MTPTETTGVHRSRHMEGHRAASGVALLVLVTIHMVAHHFVVEEVGGLRTYAQVLDYIANPVMFVLEVHVPGRGHDPRDARSPLGALRLRTLGAQASGWWRAACVVLGVVTVAYGVTLIGVLASRA